jgi:hypothetical protein
MIPYTKNVILASADQVAIDAVAAKLMGFDPLRDIKFIRLAHEQGLGCGDPRDIQIVGDTEAAGENWHFVGPFQKMTFASRMQHQIYWGPLKKPLEWSLKTILAPWAYIASVLYHDFFWYPTHQALLQKALQSDWGRLFHNWERVTIPPDALTAPGWPDVGPAPSAVDPRYKQESKHHYIQAMKILAECIKEAPEFSTRHRRLASKSQPKEN